MSIATDLAGHALDGRYELRSLIGEGTFGRVYRGFDRRLERAVAVKVIKPWWAQDRAWAERMRREARVLARLSDPRIVAIHDVGQADEGIYYVAELVEGESLARRLARGPVEPALAAAIAEQVCSALAHAHAAGVVHRDIKPANVLLSDTGLVKLGDFSLARLVAGGPEGPPTLAGTPAYMAPEQARGESCTPASDLYSLGVVLRVMLGGRPGGPGLDRVLARALEEDPAQRYGDAAAMASDLAAARRALGRSPQSIPGRGSGDQAGGTAATVAHETPDPPARTRVAPVLAPRRLFNPPARRRAAAIVGAVAALAVAMVVAAALIDRPSSARVPDVYGLTRPAAGQALRHANLTARFVQRYATATRGTAVWQFPAPSRRVRGGSAVEVALSAGPAPVRLPALAGQSLTQATARLARLGLRATAARVPAPGVAAGTVTGQSPVAGRVVPAHATVRLAVAEMPSWRTIASFSGQDAGDSGLLKIRGHRWRVVYRMSYVGTCTFIFWCDGPTADVRMPASGADVTFDLKDGGERERTFATGPGTYRVLISPGSDTAQWWVEVQDLF